MLARGERARRVHVIDHELRFNPNRRKAATLIAQGFVGAPRHALLTAVNASRLDPTTPWGWWFDESQGGGLLGAVGSHQVDLLRYWLGDIAAVAGTAEPVVPERPLPDGRGPPPGDRGRVHDVLAPLPVGRRGHRVPELRRRARGRPAGRGVGRRGLPSPRRGRSPLGRPARPSARRAVGAGDAYAPARHEVRVALGAVVRPAGRAPRPGHARRRARRPRRHVRGRPRSPARAGRRPAEPRGRAG